MHPGKLLHGIDYRYKGCGTGDQIGAQVLESCHKMEINKEENKQLSYSSCLEMGWQEPWMIPCHLESSNQQGVSLEDTEPQLGIRGPS